MAIAAVASKTHVVLCPPPPPPPKNVSQDNSDHGVKDANGRLETHGCRNVCQVTQSRKCVPRVEAVFVTGYVPIQ